MSFAKIAIVNRGEPAVRALRAVRELEAEHRMGLRSVALYTRVDTGATYVLDADEAIELPIPEGAGAAAAYLDAEGIIERLIRARVEAVWVGWGFLSEDAHFAQRVRDAGLVFIGPPPEAMRVAGDKIAAKQVAEKAGVPVVPWSGGPVADIAEARAVAERIGYPLALKAAAGGGGRGIRMLREPGELEGAFRAASGEAERAFGDGRLFVESCVSRARHLEVQVAVDAEGFARSFGVRDCTLQRRHQKLMEEAPGPVTDDALRETLESHAIAFATGCGYCNVGTVEFIYDLEGAQPYFMEMNARLQVEHTVSELVYGVDLVKLQIGIARGLSLRDARYDCQPRGYAIQLRLNAEDPDNGYAPAPGRVLRFTPPQGPGLRVDAGIATGSVIPPDFDSMVAKLIAFGHSRAEAMARLRRALRETAVVIEGGATNKSLHAALLDDPDVIRGSLDTAWLDRQMAAGGFDARPHAAEALLASAVLAYRAESQAEITNFFAAAARGIPQRIPPSDGREIGLNTRGGRHQARIYCIGYGCYRVYLDQGPGLEVRLDPQGDGGARLSIEGRSRAVLYQATEQQFYVEVEGVAHRIERDAGGMVRAPAPSMLMELSVAVGDRVEEGQRLGSLEAMKMEMPLRATHAGVVTELLVQANSQVAAGQPLLVVEPLDDGAPTSASTEPAGVELPEPRADLFLSLFDAEGRPQRERLAMGSDQPQLAAAVAREMERVMQGYDLDPRRLELLVSLFDDVGCFELVEAPDAWRQLATALHAFVDTESVLCDEMLPPASGSPAIAVRTAYYEFLRRYTLGAEGAHPELLPLLRRALRHYNFTGEQLDTLEPDERMQRALARLAAAHGRDEARAQKRHRLASSLMRALIRLHRAGADFSEDHALADTLDRMPLVARARWPFLLDNAHQTRYVLFRQPRFEQREKVLATWARQIIEAASQLPAGEARLDLLDQLIGAPQSLFRILAPWTLDEDSSVRGAALEVLLRRLYDAAPGRRLWLSQRRDIFVIDGAIAPDGTEMRVLAAIAGDGDGEGAIEALSAGLGADGPGPRQVADLLVHPGARSVEEIRVEVERLLSESAGLADALSRVTLIVPSGAGVTPHFTFVRDDHGHFEEVPQLRNLHPDMQRRLELWRLANFELTRVESHERLLIYHAQARQNPQDERIFIIGEVRDVPEGEVHDAAPGSLPGFEHGFLEAVRALREIQALRAARRRYHWSRITLFVRPVVSINRRQVMSIGQHFSSYTKDLNLDRVVVRARIMDPDDPDADVRDTEIRVASRGGHKIEVRFGAPSRRPIPAASPYAIKVQKARARGVPYPYEVVRMITSRPGVLTLPGASFPPGSFVEYDLDPDQPAREEPRAVSVEGRPPGENRAALVFGLISNETAKHPEGMQRVIVLSDPLRNMGALAEPECRRIMAAIDLARERGLPLEWVPVSSGARIDMRSGTENLDWTARVLRRIIEFTRDGGEINIIVDGVNVGAQSYFNAEATMLMHCRGVLIMTARGSMVLTGKRALDYSGGVSAEDERGIGGFERIMGPNGQAQYYARDIAEAFQILFEHYRYSYIVPGEQRVRVAESQDAPRRDITAFPYRGDEGGAPFAQIGDVFSAELNRERKKPFDMRALMASVIDGDGGFLERFAGMRAAETAIVWDCHLGGEAVCLIGFESRPLARVGHVPGDGPDTWTGGTLFPRSSKKVARALNAASGRRPVVVLANLSGFDGSPESMRKLQLEYGAEIGRAVVDFEGPIVFAVVARYHGGAYVVFSKALNENLHALAVEGSYASVIGGAPAAAVVFPGEVRARTLTDPQVAQAQQQLDECTPADRPRLRETLSRTYAATFTEKQREVAREFDDHHSVYRACRVGSLDEVTPPAELRQRIIAALTAEKGEN